MVQQQCLDGRDAVTRAQLEAARESNGRSPPLKGGGLLLKKEFSSLKKEFSPLSTWLFCRTGREGVKHGGLKIFENGSFPFQKGNFLKLRTRDHCATNHCHHRRKVYRSMGYGEDAWWKVWIPHLFFL